MCQLKDLYLAHLTLPCKILILLAYAESRDGVFICRVKRLKPTREFRQWKFVDTVCLLPHAQSGSSRMPHTCREAAQIPWPVRYRVSGVQSLRLRSKPGWQEFGSVMKNGLGISCLAQYSFQVSSKILITILFVFTYVHCFKKVDLSIMCCTNRFRRARCIANFLWA